MSITSAKVVSDVILFVRDVLKANLTDPISSTRAKGRYVMTSYPREKVEYPIITVRSNNVVDSIIGQSSEKRRVDLSIEVRVWARNEKEKNNIWDAIYNFMSTNQYPSTTSNTSLNVSLFDFNLASLNDLDEDGEEGVRSKIAVFNYSFIVN